MLLTTVSRSTATSDITGSWLSLNSTDAPLGYAACSPWFSSSPVPSSNFSLPGILCMSLDLIWTGGRVQRSSPFWQGCLLSGKYSTVPVSSDSQQTFQSLAVFGPFWIIKSKICCSGLMPLLVSESSSSSSSFLSFFLLKNLGTLATAPTFQPWMQFLLLFLFCSFKTLLYLPAYLLLVVLTLALPSGHSSLYNIETLSFLFSGFLNMLILLLPCILLLLHVSSPNLYLVTSPLNALHRFCFWKASADNLDSVYSSEQARPHLFSCVMVCRGVNNTNGALSTIEPVIL